MLFINCLYEFKCRSQISFIVIKKILFKFITFMLVNKFLFIFIYLYSNSNIFILIQIFSFNFKYYFALQ